MPGGSGIDVLKKLKLSIKTKHLPVLVITGDAGNEMRSLVKCLGTADRAREARRGGTDDFRDLKTDADTSGDADSGAGRVGTRSPIVFGLGGRVYQRVTMAHVATGAAECSLARALTASCWPPPRRVHPVLPRPIVPRRRPWACLFPASPADALGLGDHWRWLQLAVEVPYVLRSWGRVASGWHHEKYAEEISRGTFQSIRIPLECPPRSYSDDEVVTTFSSFQVPLT